MTTEQETKALFAESSANVSESASLFDTILICSEFYGQEQTVQGWFTTFAAFGAQEEHHFFTIRNESIASAAYCNLQSADSLDFPFLAYNIGLRFFGPASNICGTPTLEGNGGAGLIDDLDPAVAHFFCYDLPNHCSISLKTQQDTRIELTCYACPPGYGPCGGGAAFEITQLVAPAEALWQQHMQMNMFGTQGIPYLTNRFKLPTPIGIPRNGIIEGVLKLSEYARYVISRLNGPTNYFFAESDRETSPTYTFPQRFGIQFSVFGKRLVQQRGQYHV